MDHVLASSSFLASGIFWAGAGTAVGALAIVVSVVLWVLGSPRRLLVYNLDSETALLRSDARLRTGADLEVTVNGEVVADPYVASFRVESRSRRDIRPEDFAGARPVIFEMAAPILKLLDTDTGGDAMPEVPISIDGSRLTIRPSLIKSKQAIKVTVLTDGPVSVTCPRPALTDVMVRQLPSGNGPPPAWLKSARLVVVGTCAIGFVVLAAGKIMRKPELVSDSGWIIMMPLVTLVAAGIVAVVAERYRVGWMRGLENPNPDHTSDTKPY
jgi:hypothetical protein